MGPEKKAREGGADGAREESTERAPRMHRESEELLGKDKPSRPVQALCRGKGMEGLS